MPTATVGTGTTLTLPTAAGTNIKAACLLSISGPSSGREAINTSCMTTTSDHTFIPSDLLNTGELTFEVQFEGDMELPALAALASGTWVIDWGGESTGHIWTFSGFATSISPSAEVEEVMTASITVTVTGDITIS